MPKLTIDEPFKPDPNYNEEAALSKEIEYARSYLTERLRIIDAIHDKSLQLIGMFTLLDSMAQEEANYPANSKEAFSQFVLRHQKQCDYLTWVDPVTLYYHMEDMIEEVEWLPGFPPEKEICIEDMGGFDRTPIRNVLQNGLSQKLLDYAAKKKGAGYAEKLKREHSMISLLYRMRSKAVHEMSSLGQNIVTCRKDTHEEPYYRQIIRSYVQDSNWVSDDVIELIIPNVFIRLILSDCVNGYLQSCKDCGRFPLDHNHLTRKCYLSWYDK